MRNFFAAVALVIFGTANNLAIKPGSAPTAKDAPVAGSAALVSSKDRKYPASEVLRAKRVLIATVPDPKLTRLSLHFDRWVESLHRAAEASGYVLKQQWIPWTTNEITYDEPGVLLFQLNNAETLAVLLVGESPVSGISEAQFRRALLDGAAHLTGIVGPSFSGGFSTLSTLLSGYKDVRVASGSATNKAASEGFAARHKFQTTVDTDEQATNEFETYLRARGVSFRKSAVLAEGDTTYGAGEATESSIRVTFPRDLSVLRRAYEADMQLRKSISQASDNLLGGSSVSLQRSEDGMGRDSVPVQSPAATAATQELAVQAVARRLNEDRVALANVLATNTLDILFLRQYMAARVPDMQFILFEPDLLFTHVPEVYAFQGTLAVSRYPLTLAQSPRLVAFPSKAAEGVYWAARSLLGLDSMAQSPKVMRLSMIGFDGYWPVADLNGSPQAPAFLPPKTYVAIWSAIAGASIFAACAAWFGLRTAKRKGAPRKWFADFTFDRDAPMAYAREHHFYCLVLGLAAIFLLLARPLQESWGQWAYLPTVFVIAALGVAWPSRKDRPSNLHSWWLDPSTSETQRGLTLLLTVSITLLIGTFVVVLYDVVWKANDFGGWSRFAAYRSIYLTSGVNPTLPLLLMGLSILACAWYHFQRTIFASERFVPIDLCLFGTLEGPYNRVRDILAGYATMPGLIISGLTAAIVIVVALAYRSALTIEGRVYDAYVILLLAISAAFTMLSVCQFLQAWWHFSDFLRGLEGLPIRHVFTKLPRNLGTVALFRNSPRSRSYLYLLKSRDCLRLLKGMPKWMTDGVEESTGQLLIRTGKDERETGDEAIRAQLSLLYPCAYLMYYLQKRVWWKGESDLQPKKDQPVDVALAEEFVTLRFLGFIRYTILQLRNLLTLFSVSFILQAMAVSCYPFFSQSLSQMYLGAAFAILSISIGYVLVQLSRDAIMQRLSTDPATGTAKDHPILAQALQSASLPLLAFASTYFPDLGRMLFSWVGPLASAGGK